MAGRRPSESRDSKSGVTPLRGRRVKTPAEMRKSRRRDYTEPGTWIDGEYTEIRASDEDMGGPGGFEPEFEGQRRPFGEGNRVSTGHGAYSEQEIAPRADALVAAVLADPQMPDHLRSPAFRFSLAGWARMEASSSLLLEHISGQGIGAMITPRLGGTRSPMEIWKSFDDAAAKRRSELGISPVSYARLMKDLGLTQRAQDDALERLSGQGAAIVARRAELESGSAPPA